MPVRLNRTQRVTPASRVSDTPYMPTPKLARLPIVDRGFLFYNGKSLDPSDFTDTDYDVKRLSGRCRDCGKVLYAIKAVPVPDEYAQDVDGDDTPVVMCDGCRAIMVDSI